MFLKEIMLKMGFVPNWVSLVMKCVTSVSYSLLVNGQRIERIFSQIGFRQGDLLLLYLFLMCTEGFY